MSRVSDDSNLECLIYLKALSDETRWKIVRLLASSRRPLHLSELAEKLELSNYNASRHIRILSDAGIVDVEKEGRFKNCSIAPEYRSKIDSQSGSEELDLGCCRFDFSSEAKDKAK